MQPAIQDLTNSKEYTVVERIFESDSTSVFRAKDRSNGRPVLLKIVSAGSQHVAGQACLRNEYVIASKMAESGVVSPLELISTDYGDALIMEDDGAISLDSFRRTNFISIELALEISLQLCEVLQHLGHHRVLHKDINPNNIFIHPDSHRVRLTGFDFASLLPRETQEMQSPIAFEGTLSYTAPEYTGRINRSLDYRADFHSIGVTLYELVTGQLPFTSNDSMELIHCHIARAPLPPIELRSDMPQALSDIVLKLMAENAQARYQTAQGLHYDLQHCLQQWQNNGDIRSFELAQHDLCDRFLIPDKLFGREGEVQTLLDSFERVSCGASELLLVAGYPGVGKTALVNEVRKTILERRGYFVTGKFDQFNRNSPCSAFVIAYRDLISQLLGESEPSLRLWKAKILHALDGNGQVIIDVIPELEGVIGAQPALAELESQAAQNRFLFVFQQFATVFAAPIHPLVIFIDDLQWADVASLRLMEVLLTDIHAGHLLLIGAYRDNEVFKTHRLMHTVDDLRKQGVVNSTIVLAPLSEEYVNQLLSDTLGCTADLTQPLTKVIFQNTNGNPYFTRELLNQLYKDKLIVFDRQLNHWICDMAQVHNTVLSDDVLEFLVRRLHKMPGESQRILKHAACVGIEFTIETLCVICEDSSREIAEYLWHALDEGLIVPVSQQHMYLRCESNSDLVSASNEFSDCDAYRFVHDQVQLAAYSLIDDDEKNLMHYQIGTRWLNSVDDNALDDRIFDIVGHLNQGVESITRPAEKLELAQLNLKAGERAKAAAAFDAACDYYCQGLEFLPPKAWQTDYPTVYKLHFEAIRSAYMTGRRDKADSLQEKAQIHAATDLDRAALLRLQMTQYLLSGLKQQAITIHGNSMQLLGWSVPTTDNDIESTLLRQVAKVDTFLKDHTLSSLKSLPLMEDETCKEMMRSLQILFYAAWFDGKTRLAYLALAKMTTLSLDNGNSEMSPFGYVGYGLLLNAHYQKTALACEFGEMAVQLCDSFEHSGVSAMTNFLFAADVHSWGRPIAEAETYYENAYRFGMEASDWLTVCFMMMQSGSDRLTAGKSLHELHVIVQSHVEFLTRVKHFEGCDALVAGVLQPVRNLLGLTHAVESFDDDVFCEADYLCRYKEVDFQLSWLYSVRIRNAYLLQIHTSYEELIPWLKVIEQTVPSHTKVPSATFYVVLMYLHLVEKEPLKERREGYWREVEALESKLARWCLSCSENILHKCLLIRAERARLDDRTNDAMVLYDQSIAEAARQGYIYEEALGNELAGHFYLGWDRPKIASFYLQEAHRCYKQWGAKAKTDALQQQFPSLLAPVLMSSQSDALTALNKLAPVNLDKTGISETTPSAVADNAVFDLATVLKSSQVLAECVDLDQLLRELAPMMLQTSGADRLAIVLLEDDALRVRMIATDSRTQLLSVCLEDCTDLPVNLFRYVRRTGKVLVVDGTNQSRLLVDPYLQAQPHRSVLCLPMRVNATVVGLLYLQHRTIAGVFSHDRITVLSFLCAQAAIAYENALLHRALEQNLELETANSRMLTSVLETTTDYISVFTADEKILYLNKSFEDLGGNLVVDEKTSFFSRVFPDSALHALRETALPEVMAHGNWTGESTLIDKYGFEIPVSQLMLAHRDESGELQYISTVMRDIRVLKNTEQALQTVNSELAKVAKTKDEFLATMSHELRTPLSAILSITEGLREGVYGQTTEDQLDSFEVIQQSGRHLQELINEVLDLAKIESGSTELDVTPVDIVALCQTSVKLMAQSAEKKNINLELQVPFNLPMYPGDEKRLRQVLVNLLGNAIKFTGIGGRINLQVQHCINKGSGSMHRNFVSIAVSDTGIGIEAIDRESVFEPFVQVDSSLNRTFEGSGLGLALVRKFVELHAGSVRVESEPGIGSCFTIELPYVGSSTDELPAIDSADGSQSGSAVGSDMPGAVSESSDDSKVTILLVEDNPHAAKATARHLRYMGYRVVLVNDGESAIVEAAKIHPDLILMDVQMPGIDGFEATRRLRTMPATEGTPVIMLTGLAMPDDATRCLDAGANRYLSKPYRMHDLVSAICELTEVDVENY